MPQFGKWQIYHPEVQRAGRLARWYVRLFSCSSYTAHNFFIHMNALPLKADPRTILDAGCGKGDFTFYLAEKHQQAQVEGWDKADADLHELGQNILICEQIREISGLSNAAFYKKDLRELSSPERYDLIISIHVLEHIQGNQEVLEKFFAALRPGGQLHLQMPSVHEGRFPLLQKYTDMNEWVESEHTGELYNMEQMLKVLRRIGFTILRHRTDGHFLASLLFDVTETLRRRRMNALYGLMLPLAKTANRLLRPFDNHRGNLIILAEKPQVASA